MILADDPLATGGTFFAGIVTARPMLTAEFYVEHFEFRIAIGEPDFLLLIGPEGQRLAIKRAGDDTQPAALQTPTRGTGFWLVLEVTDPDARHDQLAAAGAEIVAPPAITPIGARCFIVRDPSGVLLHVSERVVFEPVTGATSAPAFSHDDHHRHPVHRLSRHRHAARPRVL